jgi:hypothetical protein
MTLLILIVKRRHVRTLPSPLKQEKGVGVTKSNLIAKLRWH